MYTKDQLLASLKSETAIIKHLATCVPADQLEYRASPAQRSTLELLQYLTMTAESSVRFGVSGSWDSSEAVEAASKSVTLATFAKAMDRQLRQVTAQLKPFSDKQLAKKAVKHWNGKTMPLSVMLVELALKTLVAYRMQLFLAAKASGATTIGSSDLWMGKSAKPAKAVTAAKAAKAASASAST